MSLVPIDKDIEPVSGPWPLQDWHIDLPFSLFTTVRTIPSHKKKKKKVINLHERLDALSCSCRTFVNDLLRLARSWQILPLVDALSRNEWLVRLGNGGICILQLLPAVCLLRMLSQVGCSEICICCLQIGKDQRLETGGDLSFLYMWRTVLWPQWQYDK